MATPLRIVSTTLASLLFFYHCSAQTFTPKYISITNYTKAYYEYLPQGYDPEGSQTYPLLLFIHGAGDVGDGSAEQLSKLLKVGLTRQINIGKFPVSFTINGQNFKFIIISPQFTQMPEADLATNSIEAILNYAIQHYKVDVTRIYMTGLSKGGGYTFDFAGKNAANANRLAAIVPTAEASLPVYAQARTIAAANLPVWATHNLRDIDIPVSYTTDYINWINESPAPTPLARKTIFPTGGHDSWTQTYNPEFRENGMNIYEWMLQYQRRIVTATTPVIRTESFVVKPNPAKDKIEIEIQSTENGLATFSIFSINGMLVKQWTLNKQARLLQHTIPVNDLAAGSYLLQIRIGKLQESKPFIRN